MSQLHHFSGKLELRASPGASADDDDDEEQEEEEEEEDKEVGPVGLCSTRHQFNFDSINEGLKVYMPCMYTSKYTNGPPPTNPAPA